MNKLLALLLLHILVINLGLSQETMVSEQTGIESEITIAVNPNNPDEVIVASMGTNTPIIIYTSNDGGTNWTQTSFGEGVADPVLTYGDNNTAYLTYLDFGNTLEMYVAASTDNGTNWSSQQLTLDNLAADRQWIKRDNANSSPYYGNIYLTYFHPEGSVDIHIVKIGSDGSIGNNHPVHSTTYNFVQNPAMDVTASGIVVVCFLAQNNTGNWTIESVHSTDGSDSFSNESTVADIYMYDNSGTPVTDVIGFAPGSASRLGNSLQMAIDKSPTSPNLGRVYLTWTDFVADNPAEGMNIYLSHSDDNGINWSTPQIVNDDNAPSTHQYYAGIDVNPSGVVCLGWYDRRDDATNDAMTDFYFSYSKDGGETFEPSVKITTVPSDHTAVTNGLVTFGVGEYTSLASSETDAYLVWSDGRENNGDMDVYFAKINLDDINSIQETKLQPSLIFENISPNPTSDNKAQLMITARQVEEVEISILDMIGNVVKSEVQSLVIGENSLSTNLRGLPAGHYLIRINHQYGIASKKIILTK